MRRRFSVVLLVLIIGGSCNLFKAGNLVDLHYPIETNLKLEVVEQYLDTLIQKKGFNVPDKWKAYDKLVNLDSVTNKRIYFKQNPEEMYLISLQGMIILSDVFNESIKENDWVAEQKSMPPKEEMRVIQRFKTQILDSIEAMAKRDNIPDSLIYK